jgi:hypothetical protein
MLSRTIGVVRFGTYVSTRTWYAWLARFRAETGGSAAVEYVGLAIVVSMLFAAAASAIDSATGQHLANAIVTRLVNAVVGPPESA